MVILDGKAFAQKYRTNLKTKVDELKSLGIIPGLAVVIIGEDPASKIYVRNKMKGCEEIGINSITVELPESISQEEAENEVIKLANRKDVDGIIVQLPLPKKFNEFEILKHIPVEKDVDGLSSGNIGKLCKGEECLLSCTPGGIIELLKEYNIEFSGKHAVVIGRSNMVGKPISLLLQKENCTVTMCHSRTVDLKKYTLDADILVVAIGKGKFVTGDMVKEGSVVVDVGMNRENGVLCGDVDFDEASKKAAYITPVPGGVGPMTVTYLLSNTVKASCINHGIKF